MKCKNLNTEVTIEDVENYNGLYVTTNRVEDSSYSYSRESASNDQYNTHFTVFPTGDGEGKFEKFHISLNFSSLGGIRNAKINYKKSRYDGFDDKNLLPSEKEQFRTLLEREFDSFDAMAQQFWVKVRELNNEAVSMVKSNSGHH